MSAQKLRKIRSTAPSASLSMTMGGDRQKGVHRDCVWGISPRRGKHRSMQGMNARLATMLRCPSSSRKYYSFARVLRLIFFFGRNDGELEIA